MPKPDILDIALKRFKQASDAENKQRLREKDDLRFQVPEYQWDDGARAARGGTPSATGISGAPAVPPRPMLSISKIDQPIEIVKATFSQSHLGVNIHPLSPDADDDTAEVLQGLYRSIERTSHADQARLRAYDRAIKCGRGFYRVRTDYDPTSDSPFDQRILIEGILYQDCVYFDPSATKPDLSDAEWAFVTAWVPIERFKGMYPKAGIANADQLDFAEVVRQQPDWIKFDGDQKAVLVAEHWYKEHDYEDIKGPNGQVRTKDNVTLYVCKMTAVDLVEDPVEWNGVNIPIIPVIGRELQPFDGQRRFVGIIGPAKDGQRAYNYAVSNAVELAALEPKAPWQGTPEQFEGFEQEYQQANIRNFPVLHYNPVMVGGSVLPPPARTQQDTSKLTVSMQIAELANDAIQATTYTYDPSLGRQSAHKSGKAIQAEQDQASQGNSNYLNNFADISMTYEATVILDMIPRVYDTARVVKILDEEDTAQAIMVNAPFVQDQDGNPQPVPPPQPGMPPQPPMQGQKHFDLAKGVYGVSVSVGKSYESRFQEGGDALGELLQAMPNLFPILGPLWLKFKDFPGSKEAMKDLIKVRDAQYPMLSQPDQGEQPTPDQLAAQNQALQSQLQQAQQQLQQAGQAIQTDQAKQQATLQKAQLDGQVSLQKAQMDNETRVKIASDKNQMDLVLAKLDSITRILDSGATRGHEVQTQHMDLAHEALMGGVQHAQAKDISTHQAGEDAQTIAAQAALTKFTGPNEQELP